MVPRWRCKRLELWHKKQELHPSSCIQLVFHIFILNKVLNDNIPIHITLVDINEEEKIILEAKTIFG